MAFSPSGIKNCLVKIDDDAMESCQQINDNFFVVEWNARRYQYGLHSITIIVSDNDDGVKEVTQPFRLDEKQTLKFDIMAEFLLKMELTTILVSIFWCSIVLLVAPLILFRVWHELIKGRKNFMCV